MCDGLSAGFECGSTAAHQHINYTCKKIISHSTHTILCYSFFSNVSENNI